MIRVKRVREILVDLWCTAVNCSESQATGFRLVQMVYPVFLQALRILMRMHVCFCAVFGTRAAKKTDSCFFNELIYYHLNFKLEGI